MQSCTLYILSKFNYKAIDSLILLLEEKDAYVVPIQITIANEHRDSATIFRNGWQSWGPDQLPGYNDNVHIQFLWIWEELDWHLIETTEAVYQESRYGGKYLEKEGLTEYHINMSVADLNSRIGQALKIAHAK
ncbi:5992_t:CDS:1 [Paraglomus brasilianum]|uniref:5992_t:CDS:1 n=1 Tax=Paraglomus brasilianum TaxID=144538 RepID=A0A9N9DEY6_9GLOM|nr:5992_t:CDS:1 [Paraglomus brasilianum]